MTKFAVSLCSNMHMYLKRSCIRIKGHHIEGKVAVCPLKSSKRVYQIKVPNLQEQVQYIVQTLSTQLDKNFDR